MIKPILRAKIKSISQFLEFVHKIHSNNKLNLLTNTSFQFISLEVFPVIVINELCILSILSYRFLPISYALANHCFKTFSNEQTIAIDLVHINNINGRHSICTKCINSLFNNKLCPFHYYQHRLLNP